MFFLKTLFNVFRKIGKPQAMPFKGKVWAVAGGKGGVGKSFISCNLASGLAMKDKRVIVIDADLAGANLHTFFGIRLPERTLSDFIEDEVSSIEEIMLPVPGGDNYDLRLICGAADILELANPQFLQHKKLLKGFRDIDSDFVIIDIGAGSINNNLDFFNLADVGIIVTTTMPTAIQNAYGFLKMAIQRKVINTFDNTPSIKKEVRSLLKGGAGQKGEGGLSRGLSKLDRGVIKKIEEVLFSLRYGLVVNMATEAQGQRVAKVFSDTAYNFIGIRLPHIGTIERGADVEKSILEMVPLMFSGSGGTIVSINRIVDRVSAIEQLSGKPAALVAGPQAETAEQPSALKSSFSDKIDYMGRPYQVITGDLGAEESSIRTVVYYGKKSLFSKTSGYDEIRIKGNPDAEPPIKALHQHNMMMELIEAGRFKNEMAVSS